MEMPFAFFKDEIDKWKEEMCFEFYRMDK